MKTLGEIRVLIPEDLHDGLRRKKVEMKTTIKQLVIKAIKEMLNKDG